MTPIQLIESYLEGYTYTTIRVTITTYKIGQVTHRIDIDTSPKGIKHCICVYIGQTGIVIIAYPPTERMQNVTIPYADPELKTKLRQITS